MAIIGVTGPPALSLMDADLRPQGHEAIAAEPAAVLRLLEHLGTNTSCSTPAKIRSRWRVTAVRVARGGLVLDEVDRPESAPS